MFPGMKKYVEGLLESELPRAVDNVGVKMLRVTEEFSRANATSNSRLFIAFQTAILKSIEEYGALLRQRLAQFEPAHAPLIDADFDKAKASIDKLKDEALTMYKKKLENQKAFGGSGLPFDEPRLTAAVESAKNELAGLQVSFRTSQSTVAASDWVRAADAVEMLAPILTEGAAQKRICERAHNGLIQARAESYHAGDAEVLTDVAVPADFWWAEGGAALEQNWPTGDFSTWIDRRIHLRAFGVTFRHADIEKMLPPQRQLKTGTASQNDDDRQIISRLEAVVPSAALSYDQAIRDLGDDDRVSFRGPALELREALREVLDHLAPDDEVTRVAGYKRETDRDGPTMKQKVRFIMKTRKSSNAAPEEAVTAFNESIAGLTRAVYDLGTKATHVAGERRAVVQLRRYVVAILHDILAS